MENRSRKLIVTIMFCAGVILLALPVCMAASEAGKLIHEKDSLYHRIFVYKNGSVITLQFDKRPNAHIQSQVDINDLGQHKLEYTMLTFSGLLYKPEPNRVLVLGLGGGVIPRELHYYFPKTEIDVVEIDAEIPKLARQFFGFQDDDKLKVHIDDGRMFIKKQLRRDAAPKYDIIILDAFNGDYIPFHLMTKEFLEEVKGVLAKDGVVIANVFSSNRLFDAELKTFLAVFGRCQVFVGAYSGNAMLVSPGPAGGTITVKEASERANALHSKHKLTFNMIAVAERLQPDVRPDENARILTDDRAPVNWLLTQKKKQSPVDVNN